jgi:hypothetical protein
MNSERSAGNSLRELELEVEAEGREWMRRRLAEKLQAQVEQHGAIFPPQPKKGAPSRNNQRRRGKWVVKTFATYGNVIRPL